jgi:hypothetical protein
MHVSLDGSLARRELARAVVLLSSRDALDGAISVPELLSAPAALEKYEPMKGECLVSGTLGRECCR